ncbi:MAG: hemolysin III family protein [Spirochaetales bacterium]|uniref:Hemolysin III family protein n=1 Tax=Candidatus Thalassospirochaeta sargassi TaxID=3119039 RepID=A0AAJ1IC16_9SPIO|nr:hemolysin III family protein [Spirochaetales bacterium]
MKDCSQDLELVEQKLNSVTHGIGAGMSIVGMIILLVLSTRANDPWMITSFAVYCSFQILLYLSSTLTHVFHDMPKPHSVLRVLDQAAVYLLIAGTYTPVALIVLRGSGGWWMFGIEWGMAVAGILMKSLFIRGKHLASDLLYLPMGWLILFFIRPLSALAPGGLLMWIFIGGGCYSIGIIFYIIKKIPLGHVIWHLFVLAGSISFYLGFILHLV